MPKTADSDRAFLHGFLKRLTPSERETLRYNVGRGVSFSTPDKAIPCDGYG